MSKAKSNLSKAKENFVKLGEEKGFWNVHKLYDRVIRVATNQEEHLFPPKKHRVDQAVYHSEEEYEGSFNDIKKFAAKYTEAQKKSFDVIIYHRANSDGVISGFICWDYVTEGGKKEKPFEIYRLSPYRGRGIARDIQRILRRLEGKNVFISDLAFNRETYEAIKDVAALLVAIDDHPNPAVAGLDFLFQPREQSKQGEFHAASALTWKFFHPNEMVPYYIQYIDSGDAFLHLSYLPQVNAFQTAMAVRFVKNQKRKNYVANPINMFKDIQELFSGKATQGLNFMVVLGNIMNRYRENMKAEIADKAELITFHDKQGKTYKVAVLNYSQPGLLKAVIKFVASEYSQKGAQFAVAWFYNYGAREFDVTIANDHTGKPGSVNMKLIARQFGGDGKINIAHFKLKGTPGDIQKIIR